MLLRRRHERLRGWMPSMASSASYRRTGVLELADIVGIDLLGHLEHQPCRGLFLFGVICKVQARFSVGANVVRIGDMTGVAMRA